MPARGEVDPSIGFEERQTGRPWRLPTWSAGTVLATIECTLEAERDQLALWIPVALGAGIAAWFGFGDAFAWRLFLIATAAIGLVALAIGRWTRVRGSRLAQAIAWVALLACFGCALAWARSARVAAPILLHPAVTQIAGEVELVEPLPAREALRLTVHTDSGPAVPPRVRVTLPMKQAPAAVTAALVPGARIAVRARLVPPARAAVPGAYDFARDAWFMGIGATGRLLAPPAILSAPPPRAGWQRWLDGRRLVLTRHIEAQLPGNEGGVAAAFVTGDVGGIDLGASDDFRRSGLAHLLSISGLHVAAVIAAAIALTLGLLALSPWLALRAPLLLIAAGVGALAGIAYTLLSGAEVPTVRSCVASLLVLGGLALGREAMTLRLVAAGALIVLLFRPEALVGPSFQLSFAAVTAIIAFADHPRVRALAAKRDEPLPRRIVRELLMLLATGLLVEGALSPIGLYHFHRAGIYGAFANIVAIPLTTFAIMPAEALALLLDIVGFGAPFWWLAGRCLALLLWLAHRVATLPGSVTALPSTPLGAYLLMVIGGLWIALWRTKLRRLGLVPLAIGAAWALATPAPDLLVTGDGRHLAVRADDGSLRLLRPRTGDYVRETLGWGMGIQARALDLESLDNVRCSADACVAAFVRGGRNWHLLALRSRMPIDRGSLSAACGWADIVVSDRRLSRGCLPSVRKLDAANLARTGGVAITLASGAITTVNGDDHHPWIVDHSYPPRIWPRPYVPSTER